MQSKRAQARPSGPEQEVQPNDTSWRHIQVDIQDSVICDAHSAMPLVEKQVRQLSATLHAETRQHMA
eukprot:1048422-Alexandrium_andersonii.AAC.1